MTLRKKYYAVFGLEESATKDDIRKAYRKLAMKYHPDKNEDPKAHQVFIDLADAYEILINDKLPKEVKNKSRKEKSFDERRKEAEIRFKNQQEREEKEQEAYFNNLTQGQKWKIFKRFAQASALLSFLLVLDTFLPKHFENHTITAFSPQYNGLSAGQVNCFRTDQNLELFVRDPYPSLYKTHPNVMIERSWIFHNPVRVWSQTSLYTKSFEVDFSVTSLFPAIPLLFLIPLITAYFRRRIFWFTLFYIFSFNIVGVCFIYFFFSQDRWLHLLTLGLM